MGTGGRLCAGTWEARDRRRGSALRRRPGAGGRVAGVGEARSTDGRARGARAPRPAGKPLITVEGRGLTSDAGERFSAHRRDVPAVHACKGGRGCKGDWPMCLETPEKIGRLQRKLYVKAKGEPSFRFYQLYDKVYRADVLGHAYLLCKSNGGACGVDEERFEDIEERGWRHWERTCATRRTNPARSGG